jgi:hypothetical protein
MFTLYTTLNAQKFMYILCKNGLIVLLGLFSLVNLSFLLVDMEAKYEIKVTFR